LNRLTLERLSQRSGFALVSVGLALILILAVAGSPAYVHYQYSSCNQFEPCTTYNSIFPQPSTQLTLNASSFTIFPTDGYQNPQNSFLLNFTTGSSPLHVYFVSANSSLFYSPGGIYPGGIYPQPNLTEFDEYLASHKSQLLMNDTISPFSTQLVQYIPKDIELITIVVTNPYNLPNSFSYQSTSGNLKLPESTGLGASIPIFSIGVALAVLGIFFERREKALQSTTIAQ
jgi:hypothetical protein